MQHHGQLRGSLNYSKNLKLKTMLSSADNFIFGLMNLTLEGISSKFYKTIPY